MPRKHCLNAVIAAAVTLYSVIACQDARTQTLIPIPIGGVKINDKGDLCGLYGESAALWYNDGTNTFVRFLNSTAVATDINNNDVVCGLGQGSDLGVFTAYNLRASPHSLAVIGGASGAATTSGPYVGWLIGGGNYLGPSPTAAINNNGDVAFAACPATGHPPQGAGPLHALVWALPGPPVASPLPPGLPNPVPPVLYWDLNSPFYTTTAYDINDAREVCGVGNPNHTDYSYPCYWSSLTSGPTILGLYPGTRLQNGVAVALDNGSNPAIVGFYPGGPSGQQHACAWYPSSPSVTIDLNPPGATSSVAEDVARNAVTGEDVAVGYAIMSGQQHGIVWVISPSGAFTYTDLYNFVPGATISNAKAVSQTGIYLVSANFTLGG